MKKRALAALGLAAVMAAALAGSAVAEQIKLANMTIKIGGAFAPKTLPAKQRVPIKLLTKGKIEMDDGSTPPAMNLLVIDFDSNGRAFNKGVPKCNPRHVANRTTEEAFDICKRSLLGKGKSVATVDFPDQDPFTAAGPLLAFNGNGSRPNLVFHVYANVPAPTAFVFRAVVKRAPGRRFGNRVITKVPEIAGGNGSPIFFKLLLARTWKYRGHDVAFAMANCRHTQMAVRSFFRFDDGTKGSGFLTRPCRRA